MTASETSYGPVIDELLATEHRLNPLGPGTPNAKVEARLKALAPRDLFNGKQITDGDMATACLAGLWLIHDFLDASHAVSQQIHKPTGSFWHSIMHRREPDYANSKYWFRKTGRHPVFPDLAAAAEEIAGGDSCARQAVGLTAGGEWNAFAFVDLCQATAEGRVPCEQLCRRIQRREWDLLFDFCYRAALADGP